MRRLRTTASVRRCAPQAEALVEFLFQADHLYDSDPRRMNAGSTERLCAMLKAAGYAPPTMRRRIMPSLPTFGLPSWTSLVGGGSTGPPALAA